MKYKLQLLDHDPIVRPVELGITLHDAQDVPDAPPADCCVPTCGVWEVTVDGVPSTGDVNFFGDNPVEFVVALSDDADLCGGCLEWDLRKLSLESSDSAVADFTLTPNVPTDCRSVTINGAGSESYVGLWLGLFPTLNGDPFCVPIIFRQFSNCTAEISGCFTAAGDTTFGAAGGRETFPGSSACNPITINVTPSTLCPTDVLTWDIVQLTGTTGNGERIDVIDPVAEWHLVFDTITDLSGASFILTPTLNGTPHPECALTFTHNPSDPC